MFKILCIVLSELFLWVFTWDNARFYKNTLRRCMQVNVVFTKVFQAYTSSNFSCSVDIPYGSQEVVYPVVEGLDVTNVIGSGMVSIVFEATLNGRPVVVKTKRRNIENKIKEGIRQARWLVCFGVDASVIDDIDYMMTSQLDFINEASNQKRFYDAFSYSSEILVPEIYLVAPDYIVMQRLYRDDIRPGEFHGKLICQFLLMSVLFNNMYHADLHVGNVIFMDHAIGILDFGIVCAINPTEYKLVLSFLKQDLDAFIDTLVVLIDVKSGKEELTKQLLVILRRVGFEIRSNDMRDMINCVKPFGGKLHSSTQQLILGVCTNEHLIRFLCPEMSSTLRDLMLNLDVV